MKWSAALPITAGNYWLRNYVFKGMEHFAVNTEPLVVRVTGQEGRLELEGDYFHDNELPFSVSQVIQGEWCGPLVPPQ